MVIKRLILASLVMLQVGNAMAAKKAVYTKAENQKLVSQDSIMAPIECASACSDFRFQSNPKLNPMLSDFRTVAYQQLQQCENSAEKLSEGLDFLFNHAMLLDAPRDENFARLYTVLQALKESLSPLTKQAKACLDCAEKLQKKQEPNIKKS